MKQALLLVIAIGFGLGAYFYYQSQEREDSALQVTAPTSSTQTNSGQTGSSPSGNITRSDNGIETSVDGLAPKGASEADEEDEEYDDRPAAEVYNSLDDALAAVKKGALDYDDIVLEQFVEPGEDCTFCPELYKKVTDLMLQSDASEDERAYYSELLAISGRKENIQTLVESIQNATNEDAADIFAESLELTIGDDNVVKYLAGFIEDKNELLQEASVAAITNQGSKLAAETLYEHTVARNDPDGYYEIGIGLGELIPEQETLPYLQEIMLKKDPYSHLAVKSLLNYGYDGLVMVFDALTNSQNPDFDKQMLTDAIDHVGYEEETEKFVKQILEKNPSPVVEQFAKDILEGFELDGELDSEDDEEADEAKS